MSNVRSTMVPLVAITVGFIISVAINFSLLNEIADYKKALVDCNVGLEATIEQMIEQENRHEEIYNELQRYDVPEAKAQRLVPIILSASEQYNIDTRLIVSQMRVESNFKPNAYSWAGARGLMQVMPFWVRVPHFQKATGITTIEELHTYEGSIRAGTYIQSHYIEKCGGLRKGLTCYNGGYKALRTPKPETVGYVKKVMKYYRGYV